MAYKIARPGSEGNMRLLKEYGGGSKGPRQSYATGGAVKGGNPSLNEGLAAAGGPGKPSGKPSKGAPKKGDKEAKTSINVVVMPSAGKDSGPMPPPGASGLAPPPGPMPPPPGPGGPPMPPMRAHGGRVKKADGGEVDDPVPAYLRERMREKKNSARASEALAGATGAIALGAKSPFMGAMSGANALMGAIERKDAKDLKRGAKAFEKTGLPGRPAPSDEFSKGGAAKAKYCKGGMAKRAVGGPVKAPTEKGLLSEKGYQGGGGGAIGRLEKLKKYGK